MSICRRQWSQASTQSQCNIGHAPQNIPHKIKWNYIQFPEDINFLGTNT